MKKIKKAWKDFKSSIKWEYAIFWFVMFNIITVPIWSVGLFITINIIFIMSLISAWITQVQTRKYKNIMEEPKTENIFNFTETVQDKIELHPNIIKIEEGCIWEGPNFEIELDRNVSKEYDLCKHVKDNKLRAIIIAYNEGGYNSTGVCADCIIEALEKNGLLKPKIIFPVN
jgi:hypothetical protein